MMWFDIVKKDLTDAEKRAEQLVIDTINRLDYVSFDKGDWIKIQPAWADKFNIYFVFNMNLIHSEVDIKEIGDSEIDLCLSRNPNTDTPMADSYVSAMLLANDENAWANLWKE
jgi:hypothetical protein